MSFSSSISFTPGLFSKLMHAALLEFLIIFHKSQICGTWVFCKGSPTRSLSQPVLVVVLEVTLSTLSILI